MGNRGSRSNSGNNDPYSDNSGNAHSHLSDSQVSRMQELFSRGLNPDIGLLPFQMPRMKVDAPPTAKEKKTIRMKNICYINKKKYRFNHLGNNKYTLHFQYSCSMPVYCTIYYLATEYTDQSNCTFNIVEKMKRPVFQYLEAIKANSESKENEYKSNNNNISNNNSRDSVRYQGTSYLLKTGYNLDFNQSNKDFIDLNAVDTRYFQFTATLGYYPVIVLFSRQKPTHSLLCIQNKQMHNDPTSSKRNTNANINSNINTNNTVTTGSNTQDSNNTSNNNNNNNNNHIENKSNNDENIRLVDSVVNYGKLVLKNDNTYTTEIVNQKMQVAGRAFGIEDIYGLDRPIDPYSGEENLCVVCMTLPKDTTLRPCRHLCMCNGCAKELLRRSNRCPVCRSYVSETLRITNEHDNYQPTQDSTDSENESDNDNDSENEMNNDSNENDSKNAELDTNASNLENNVENNVENNIENNIDSTVDIV